MNEQTAIENKQKFRGLLMQYNLSVTDVAELLDISIFTVISWRTPAGNKVPSNMLELLQFKLDGRVDK